jgi:8-oxo-dGTP diphosphatase
MWEEIASLHAHHGEVRLEVRVLKLAEETGEAAAALIGMRGWNSRKGVCATQDDLLAELSDVIITAGVAMAGITGDASQAAQAFRHRLESVLTRAGLQAPAPEHAGRHWTASAVVLHPETDKVLLIDHVKSGYWLFPGGHVCPGETLAEAAVREVHEETGIDVQIITGPLPVYHPVVTHPVPFTIIEAQAADPVNGWHQHVDALFVCYAPAGRIGQLDHREATRARWAGLEEMQELKVPGELPAITKAAISWAALHSNRTSIS